LYESEVVCVEKIITWDRAHINEGGLVMAIKVTLEYERESKRFFRFKEGTDPEDILVGTLYVRKSVFKNGRPNKIIVTVQDENEFSRDISNVG
jgi:hypothetical protein